jgi:hypothetical protein
MLGARVYICFFTATFVFFTLRAQDAVITTAADTLFGEVKLLGYLKPPKVQIAEKTLKTEKGKKRVLAISEVKRFIMAQETYDPVQGPDGIVFMKLEEEGYLSLYAYQPEGQLLYDAHLLVKKDGSRMPVPSMNFRNAMRSFLSECPDVVMKIEDKTYSRDDLPVIISEYNKCMRQHGEDRRRAIAYREFYARKVAPWDTLQSRVERLQFEEGKDVLEMINDVKGKLKRSEPVPKFLVNSLRENLSGTKLMGYLEAAIAELEKE